jgi:hypothetical protein
MDVRTSFYETWLIWTAGYKWIWILVDAGLMVIMLPLKLLYLGTYGYTSYYEKQCNTMYVIPFYFNYKIIVAIFTNKWLQKGHTLRSDVCYSENLVLVHFNTSGKHNSAPTRANMPLLHPPPPTHKKNHTHYYGHFKGETIIIHK